jgi:hypothetical protein
VRGQTLVKQANINRRGTDWKIAKIIAFVEQSRSCDRLYILEDIKLGVFDVQVIMDPTMPGSYHFLLSVAYAGLPNGYVE